MRINHVIKTDQWRSAPQIRPAPHFVVSPICRLMREMPSGRRYGSFSQHFSTDVYKIELASMQSVILYTMTDCL